MAVEVQATERMQLRALSTTVEGKDKRYPQNSGMESLVNRTDTM